MFSYQQSSLKVWLYRTEHDFANNRCYGWKNKGTTQHPGGRQGVGKGDSLCRDTGYSRTIWNERGKILINEWNKSQKNNEKDLQGVPQSSATIKEQSPTLAQRVSAFKTPLTKN